MIAAAALRRFLGYDWRHCLDLGAGNGDHAERMRDADLPRLRHGRGDLEALARLFPVPVAQGFDGRIGSVNW